MRILITGGAGFLGTHLVKRCLQEAETEITVLDSLELSPSALPENLKLYWDRIHYVRGNACNSKLLNELIPYQDVIFHCAAQTSHILSIQNPKADAAVNAESTLKILESMRFYNRKAVLVYPSTTSVIGSPKKETVDECHPLNPLDIYSVHKVLSERYCLSYAAFHGLQTVILRFANLYGPYGRKEPEYGFINHFIHQAVQDAKLQVFGRGDQIRNVTFVEDAADLMLRSAAELSLRGASWFATSPHHLSVLEIAETITSVFQSGRVVSIEWPEERKRIEVGSVKFSAKALKSKMGPIGPTPLLQGLQKTFAVFSAQHPNLFA